MGEKIQLENIRYYENPQYESTGILHSLFYAAEEMNSPTVVIYSDVLFHKNIIDMLIEIDESAEEDIVLVVEDGYQYYKNEIERDLDLVITDDKSVSIRRITNRIEEKVLRIGNKIDKDSADYEFVGIAYFSDKGIYG